MTIFSNKVALLQRRGMPKGFEYMHNIWVYA